MQHYDKGTEWYLERLYTVGQKLHAGVRSLIKGDSIPNDARNALVFWGMNRTNIHERCTGSVRLMTEVTRMDDFYRAFHYGAECMMAGGEYPTPIRDHTPLLLISQGIAPIFHAAGPEEFKVALELKLRRMINGLPQHPSDDLLADMLELEYTLSAGGVNYALVPGVEKPSVVTLRKAKTVTEGRYDKRLVLEGVLGKER